MSGNTLVIISTKAAAAAAAPTNQRALFQLFDDSRFETGIAAEPARKAESRAVSVRAGAQASEKLAPSARSPEVNARSSCNMAAHSSQLSACSNPAFRAAASIPDPRARTFTTASKSLQFTRNTSFESQVAG